MDAEWFKDQQRKAGVTSSDIGHKLGRDRTIVARIYAQRQRMTYEQAEVFASMLDVPLEDVLQRAGLRRKSPAKQGFSEGDVTPFDRSSGDVPMLDKMDAAIGGERPGVDVWQVRTGAMQLAGYLPGDWLLVDTHAAEQVASGDAVIAQIYDLNSGSAKTVLRQFQKPALVAHSVSPKDWGVHIVDDQTVMVRGIVIASWRVRSFSVGATARDPSSSSMQK